MARWLSSHARNPRCKHSFGEPCKCAWGVLRRRVCMLRDPLPGQGPRRKSLKGGTFLDLPGPQRPVQDGPIDSRCHGRPYPESPRRVSKRKDRRNQMTIEQSSRPPRGPSSKRPRGVTSRPRGPSGQRRDPRKHPRRHAHTQPPTRRRNRPKATR